MARKFYLSIVYDANGYNRFDILNNDSLKELDNIISKFKNRKEIMEAYLNEYNIDKKKGRLCIVYEDTLEKKRQLDEYHSLPEDKKDIFKQEFTYAHIIPIMYKNRRLMNLDACILVLKNKLRKPEIIKSIMIDKEKQDGLYIRKNKQYLFETEEEQDLIKNMANYREAIDLFLKRITKANEEDKYFYCRSLIDICELSISTINTKVGKITVRDGNMKDFTYQDIMTDSDRLVLDSEDMDNFYILHDLDEVIRNSSNSNRPIGSEGKKIR